MVSMDYFRRPVLAGHTLNRQTYGTVRGDIRRTDVDGTSTVPYFPGVSVANTLIIAIDGGAPVTAVMGGTPPNGILNVIADINTALGISGTAFDDDGTIAIKTATAGSAGSVQITGGTAAAALGFDLTKNKFLSFGGEIQSTPEARRGNSFGTGFLSRGENFTAESVQRGLARIAANADVLYSEAARNDAVVRQVTFTNVDGTRLQITTSTDELFTGLGLLSNASTKEDLVPYFHLIDTVTKQPAKSRVVAVVRGAPGGGPPFANATTWSGGGSAGNILGVSLDKVSASAITSIFGGRVVECAGANFSDVQPGDFASIAGATNLTPFSNNGQRWVVDEVLSNTTVLLRPMSRSELAQVGFTPSDVQPIVELNDNLQSLESFGTLTIKTGTYCSGIGVGLSVIVSPPIPTGATYQLFASQPISNRVKTVYDDQRTSGAPFKEFVSDLDPVANWTLSGLAASLSGGNCVITTGNLVWHGRVFNLPATTFLPADFANGVNYVYWSESTANYVISTSAAGFFGVLDPGNATKGHLVAVVTKGGGVLTAVSATTRLRGEKALSVTVGTGGQFPSLIDATLWAQTIQASYVETTTAVGTYPHFEFVLVSDTTTNNLNPVLPVPGCTVRGINPSVKLDLGTGCISVVGSRCELRDFQVAATGSFFVGMSATAELLRIHNVKHIASAGNSLTDVVGQLTGTIQNVRITDSSFMLKHGVVSCFSATSSFISKNCQYTYDATGAVVPHIMTRNGDVDWDGDLMVFEDCDFLNSWGATTGDLIPIFASSSIATSTMFFRNVRFSLGLFSSANANLFIRTANNATVYMNSFVMTSGSIQKLITGASANVKCYNSTFRCDPATGNAALTGHTFENCSITHTDTVAGGSGFGIDAVTTGVISECSFSGPFGTCIRVTAADIQVLNNRIDQFKQANGTPSASIDVQSGGVGSLIQGNIIVWATSAATLAGFTCITASPNNVSIIGNKCYFPSPTVSNVTILAISNGGSGGVTSNNLVAMTTTGTAAASQTVTGLTISGTEQTCTGNILNLTGSTTQNWRGVIWTPSLGIFSGNYVKSYGRTITTSTVPDATIISNNEFVSTTANSLAGSHAVNIGGAVTGNRFSAGNAANTVSCGYGSYSNNHFYTSVLLDNGLGGFGLTNFVFHGNYISGNLDATSNSPNWTKLDVVGNTIEGNVDISFSFVVGFTPHLLFGTNQVTGSVSLTSTVAVAYVVTGNEADSFNVSLQASSALFQGNRTYTGGAVVAANAASVENNIVATTLTVTHGNDPTSVSTHAGIIGNQVGTVLTVNTRRSEISNNWIGGNVSIARPTGFGAAPGVVAFSFNYCGGNFQADTIDAGTYLFDEVVVHGNYFDATTIGTWSAQSVNTTVSNNHITPTNGVTVTIGGALVNVFDNHIFATAFSTGSNQTTLLELIHTSALSKAWVNNNYVYGKVNLGFGSATGFSDLWFTKNYVFNLDNASAVRIGKIATNGGAVISQNNLTTDLSQIGTDGASGCIFFHGGGQTDNVRIQDNFLRVTTLSATYTVNISFAVVDLAGNPNSDVIFSGNIIEKPANATISAHPIVVWYLNISNASHIVVNVNLMSAGGTVGAAPERQGGLAYTAAASPYQILQ